MCRGFMLNQNSQFYNWTEKRLSVVRISVTTYEFHIHIIIIDWGIKISQEVEKWIRLRFPPPHTMKLLNIFYDFPELSMKMNVNKYFQKFRASLVRSDVSFFVSKELICDNRKRKIFKEFRSRNCSRSIESTNKIIKASFLLIQIKLFCFLATKPYENSWNLLFWRSKVSTFYLSYFLAKECNHWIFESCVRIYIDEISVWEKWRIRQLQRREQETS